MDNENEIKKSEIIYDEDWQSVSVPEFAQTVNRQDEESENLESVAEPSKIPKKKRDTPRQLLVIIQLILCLLICITAYFFKSYGGDLYDTVHSWYEDKLNSQLVFEDNTNNAGFSEILGGNTSSADEV